MQNTLELNIIGMDCADCALTLEKGVGKLEGVAECSVNFATAKMRIVGGDAALDFPKIEQLILDLGYGVSDVNERPVILSGWPLVMDVIQRPRNLSAFIGFVLLLLGFGAGWLGAADPLKNALLTLSGMVGIFYPARAAWVALRGRLGLDMNVLMTLAALGAFAIGEYGEAATVIVLFNLGEAIEGFTMERARDSIRSLILLSPSVATVLQSCIDCQAHMGQDHPDGSGKYEKGPCPWCETHELVVPVESLSVGDLILVKPGERIPMDGIVVSGRSAVDQSPITGESIPVDKTAGAEVFAGTVNLEGGLEIEITSLATDNTLARLIHMVQEAQAQKTPAQRFLDRFSRIYTPIVVMGALLIAIVPPLFFGQPFFDTASAHGWLYRALVLLVIACPCALVIATPVTVVSAISALAKRGVLVKGGAHLESLGKVQVIAFDKTGTLTHGRPELTTISCVDDCCLDDRRRGGEVNCEHCDEMLTLAAAIESRSNHPLARAVSREARKRLLSDIRAREVEVLPGQGIRGMVEGVQITIGNHDLFHNGNSGVTLADCKLYLDQRFTSITGEDFCMRVQATEAEGKTVMVVGKGDQLLGYIAVSDPPRQSSQKALEDLKQNGVQRIVMLTGDNFNVAQVVGSSLGVDEVRAGLMPEDKLTAIRSMTREFEQVAMVGDGVNDAPALAAADLGIAMGGAGTAQALETADVALMADDLSQLPGAVRLGRQAMRVMRFNIWFALLIKAAFLGAALFGAATLWMAVLADMGASLLVTLNGMRLLLAGVDSSSPPLGTSQND